MSSSDPWCSRQASSRDQSSTVARIEHEKFYGLWTCSSRLIGNFIGCACHFDGFDIKWQVPKVIKFFHAQLS